MNADLIRRRDAAVKRWDVAFERQPARTGDAFVREMERGKLDFNFANTLRLLSAGRVERRDARRQGEARTHREDDG